MKKARKISPNYNKKKRGGDLATRPNCKPFFERRKLKKDGANI